MIQTHTLTVHFTSTQRHPQVYSVLIVTEFLSSTFILTLTSLWKKEMIIAIPNKKIICTYTIYSTSVHNGALVWIQQVGATASSALVHLQSGESLR